ncbi:MAG: hypothetical protein ABI597_05305, partial [Gammaproteobacteria bacterium]
VFNSRPRNKCGVTAVASLALAMTVRDSKTGSHLQRASRLADFPQIVIQSTPNRLNTLLSKASL